MDNRVFKPFQEWLKQSVYDFGTAKAMFTTRRYIYAVFMCHLALEKALKGFYSKIQKKNPPRTHDLNFLAKNINLELPEDLRMFLNNLNDLSVPTRYPDELKHILKEYNKLRTEKILAQTQKILLWLKEKL
ncbi:MAG: HEPN domain-containing protein [Elusimicrobiota bacterium]